MNCPHCGIEHSSARGKRPCEDAVTDLGRYLRALVAKVARCSHDMLADVVAREPSKPRWCPRCGAMWSGPARMWVHSACGDDAKAVDALLLSWGDDLSPGEVDSAAKKLH